MNREDVLRLLERPAWMADAQCRNLGPDTFYPNDSDDHPEIRAICRLCDVQVECLKHAINTREEHGWWGGVDEQTIRRQVGLQPRMRPRMRPIKPIDHGTEGGAAMHRRRGEEPCVRCREAVAATNAWRDREQGRTNHHARSAS